MAVTSMPEAAPATAADGAGAAGFASWAPAWDATANSPAIKVLHRLRFISLSRLLVLGTERS
jgi:hypothetical protein